MKICKCCNKELPITSFYKQGYSYTTKCKLCISVENKAKKKKARCKTQDEYEAIIKELTKKNVYLQTRIDNYIKNNK